MTFNWFLWSEKLYSWIYVWKAWRKIWV